MSAPGGRTWDTALWLEITGYYDTEQRTALFSAYQELADFDEQAARRLRDLDEERARQSAAIEKERADLRKKMDEVKRYSAGPVKRGLESLGEGEGEDERERKVQKVGDGEGVGGQDASERGNPVPTQAVAVQAAPVKPASAPVAPMQSTTSASALGLLVDKIRDATEQTSHNDHHSEPTSTRSERGLFVTPEIHNSPKPSHPLPRAPRSGKFLYIYTPSGLPSDLAHFGGALFTSNLFLCVLSDGRYCVIKAIYHNIEISRREVSPPLVHHLTCVLKRKKMLSCPALRFH